MIGDNFFFLSSVESTNNYAMARVHAALATHGNVYFAWEQTAGKGQRGKSWEARPGENITMSIVLEPTSLLYSDQFLLSMMIALACHDLLTKTLGDEVKIKWPNDLYWRDRKAGGILIENQLQGTAWKFAVAGIGINVNQTSFGSSHQAVSFKQITGRQWETETLAKSICESVEMRWQQLSSGRWPELLKHYNNALYKKDEQVKLKKDNIAFHTVVREVSREGKLITEHAGRHEFLSGEVQWVI